VVATDSEHVLGQTGHRADLAHDGADRRLIAGDIRAGELTELPVRLLVDHHPVTLGDWQISSPSSSSPSARAVAHRRGRAVYSEPTMRSTVSFERASVRPRMSSISVRPSSRRRVALRNATTGTTPSGLSRTEVVRKPTVVAPTVFAEYRVIRSGSYRTASVVESVLQRFTAATMRRVEGSLRTVICRGDSMDTFGDPSGCAHTTA